MFGITDDLQQEFQGKAEALVRWITRNSERESTLLYGEHARHQVDTLRLCDQLIVLGICTVEQMTEWTDSEANVVEAGA